jgi:hypothetical protein
MTKELRVRIEKLADDTCWSAWYYWGANAHAHFLVWRNPHDKGLLPSARITENAVTALPFLCVVKDSAGEETLFCRGTLQNAQEACQRIVNAALQQAYREEYIPPLG